MYGWAGLSYRTSVGAISQILPRYSTSTRSLMFLHYPHVVGDEQKREAVGGLQGAQQVENLGLDGHVEGRHRLVAHHQARVSARALATATR